MLDPSKKVIVTGPEGSGTSIVTDLVAELVGWPRSDPSALQITDFKTLPSGVVHHISLPAHRPEVWWPDGLCKGLHPLHGIVVVGILRNLTDSVYSAWRRFSPFPARTDNVEYFVDNYRKAMVATQQLSQVLLSYESLCQYPDWGVSKLCRQLRAPPRLYSELGIELASRNGRYKDDFKFMNGVRSVKDLVPVDQCQQL